MQRPPPAAADPRVRAALDDIYGVFAAPRPRSIEGCTQCLDEDEIAALLTKPLRELSSSDLYPYVSSVFLTLGEPADFRYLLPRILEIAICHPGALPDDEIVLGRLKHAEWEAWPEHERAPVIRLIELWLERAMASDLRDAITQGPFTGAFEEVLCGAARAGLDINPWLARLASPEAEPLRAELADYHAKELARRSPGGPLFWDEAPEGWQAFAAVLRGEVSA